MKNKLFLFLMMLGMSFAVACSDSGTVDNQTVTPDPEPPTPGKEVSMALELVGEPGASQATLKLTAKGIKQYAYAAYKKGEEPATVSALMLFGPAGLKGDCTDGENTITLNKLSAQTEYVAYVAGIDTADEYYKEVLNITFSTKSFSDEVTQFDKEIDGYKIHVNVNDRVKAGETAYRWALLDMPQLHYLQNMKDQVDVVALLMNDQVWKNYITDDHTFVFNNEFVNRYVCDENGDPITSDEEDLALPYYYSITPGGPSYFILGEYSWGDYTDWFHVNWGYPDGDERNFGWYIPLYDVEAWRHSANSGNITHLIQDQWWEGYHHREIYEAAPATVHEGNHRIDASTLAPKGGTLTIIPDERCAGAQFFLVTEDVLAQIKQMCFHGDEAMWEKYLPWFSCSESSFDLLNGFVFYLPCKVNGEVQNIELNLERSFYCDPGMKFYLIMNGHDDETKTINGMVQPTFRNQYFNIVEFEIPQSQIPLSTVEVTPVPSEDPYSVTFNVKSPSKDALFFEYLCDYEDAWEEDGMDDPYTLENMFIYYGEYSRISDPTVMQQVNSDHGYNLTFASRPNSTSVLAAVAYNADKIMGKPSTARCTSAIVPIPDPVDEARFAEIAGEWTASATIMYSAAGSQQWVEMEKTSPVTIGNIVVSETTPQEVYDAYGRKPKEEVDALYAEFYNLVQGFNNEHRTYNRTICQGFDFQVPAEGFESYLRYADPYYLYIADSKIYNGTSTEDILWDFGPKWYIEFQQDGSAYAPFDVTNFAPLTSWTPEGFEYFLIAANINTGLYTAQMPEGSKGFPVEISDDKNTITIKGINVKYTDKETGDLKDATLYPQPVFVQTMQYNSYAWIISEVVLTRNTSAAAAQARLNAPVKGVKAQKTAINPNGGEFVQPAEQVKKSYTRTNLSTMEKRGVITLDNVQILTPETFQASADACIERNFGIKIER